MFCITGGVCFTGGLSGGPVIMPVEYLVLAGGGGGGGTCRGYALGGGGGAGGARAGSLRATGATPYTIIVGSGGVCGTWNGGCNTAGQNSCFGSIISCGGGKGGTGGAPVWEPPQPGGGGGSGGGGGNAFHIQQCTVETSGGPGIPGEGNCGGQGWQQPGASPTSCYQGGAGGGGGISTAGWTKNCPYNESCGGCGGQGCFYPFNNVFNFGELCNSCRWIGGGGAGGNKETIYTCLWGLGGGGRGGKGSQVLYQCPGTYPACNGSENMGAGGGGGGGAYPVLQPACASGGGGSGSVFLRYPSEYPDSATTGSPCYCCITNCYKYYWFKGSGSITFCPC